MRLFCWACNKPVTNEIDGQIIFRGVAFCPECIEIESNPCLITKNIVALVRSVESSATDEDVNRSARRAVMFEIMEAYNDRQV